jgi:DNA-binding CsgD family transcriptional regulator
MTTGTRKPAKARDGRGRMTRTPSDIERDLRAAELRSKSLSYRQIAAELGVSVSNAHAAVERGIREIPTEGAAEARQVELAKLDTVEQAAWSILEAHHYVMLESGPKAGTIIYHPMRPEEPLADSGPVLAAIDRILKTSERRARLMGLDAPRQSIVNVITEDMVDAEIRRLTDELKRNDPSAASETSATS